MWPHGALRADCVLQRRFCLIAHGKPLVCACVCMRFLTCVRKEEKNHVSM